VAVVVVLLLVVVVVFGAVLFLARNVFQPRTKRVSLVKILLGHAQMLSILASFTYFWPGSVALGLNSMSSAGAFSFEPVLQTVQCIVPVSFYTTYYLTLFSPAIILCLLLPAVWIARRSGRTRIHEYSVAVFVSLACHAFVLFGALSIFRCTTIADTEVLAINPSVQCTGSEFRIAQVWGGATAIGYGLLFPVGLVLLSRQPASPDGPRLKDYCRAMISSGFRPNVWFWEILYVIRRGIFATLAVCSAISSTSAEGNSISLASVTFAATGFLSICFFIHASTKPFPTRKLNLFESLAEYLQILTLLCAYLITQQQQDDQLVMGLSWTVLALNAIFFVMGTVVFLYPVVIAGWKRLSSQTSTGDGVLLTDPLSTNDTLSASLLACDQQDGFSTLLDDREDNFRSNLAMGPESENDRL
jgi:hypothetical protein